MKEILQNLVNLQTLELSGSKNKSTGVTAAELRGKIPPPILAHYDRLRARGKKGIEMVRNQVCGGCHMRVPMNVIIALMHGTDIQLCDCGRYLYLSPEATVDQPGKAVSELKPGGKPRQVKVKLDRQSWMK